MRTQGHSPQCTGSASPRICISVCVCTVHQASVSARSRHSLISQSHLIPHHRSRLAIHGILWPQRRRSMRTAAALRLTSGPPAALPRQESDAVPDQHRTGAQQGQGAPRGRHRPRQPSGRARSSALACTVVPPLLVVVGCCGATLDSLFLTLGISLQSSPRAP